MIWMKWFFLTNTLTIFNSKTISTYTVFCFNCKAAHGSVSSRIGTFSDVPNVIFGTEISDPKAMRKFSIRFPTILRKRPIRPDPIRCKMV